MSQPNIQIERGRWSDIALYTLCAFTAVTLVGYGTFGVNPQLIAKVPGAAGVYSQAFRFFALGNIWLAFLVFAVILTRRVGRQWLPSFVLLYSISLLSELSGTMT